MQKYFANKRQFWIFVGIISLSFLIRIVGFNWGGNGTTFHPDEEKVYKSAIIMARNFTAFSSSSVYPAQFSQKILFVIYTVYFWLSKLRGIGYSEVVCIYIARVLTAIFGTGTVVISYFITERIKKNAGLIGALLVGFCGPLVQQSHCSVMDTEVGSCFALAILFSNIYYEAATKKNEYLAILGMSFACSVGTMEKWYGATITLVIASIVILKQLIIKKELISFIKQGIVSIAAYVAGMFLIAPNLFVFCKGTVEGLDHVINDYDSSAPVMQSLGEMSSWLFSYMGILGLLFLICGVLFLIRNKKIETIVLGVGLIETFYMTISGQGAHLRWMQMLFISVSVVASVGITYVSECTYNKFIVKKMVCILAVISMLNIVLNGILGFSLYAANKADTSNISQTYLMENEIKPEKCIYDRYTCLRPAGYSLYYDSVDVKDSFIEKAGTKYVVKLGRDYALSKGYGLSEDFAPMIKQFKADYRVNKMTNTKYDTISWKWIDLYSICESLYYSVGLWSGKLSAGFDYYLNDISNVKGLQNISFDEGVDEKVELSSINKGKYTFELESGVEDASLVVKTKEGIDVVDFDISQKTTNFEIDKDYENLEVWLLGNAPNGCSGYIIEQ